MFRMFRRENVENISPDPERPAPEVEIRISDKGEVYYRSPGVFVEYYKNSESTADTKDPEGWVASFTGEDIASRLPRYERLLGANG